VGSGRPTTSTPAQRPQPRVDMKTNLFADLPRERWPKQPEPGPLRKGRHGHGGGGRLGCGA
jgi:hypothetical protein